MGRTFARSSRSGLKNAAPYSSGGRTATRTTSGGNSISRHAGDEAERKAAEDERDRIGDSNHLGERQERGSRCQEADEDEAVGRREVHCAI